METKCFPIFFKGLAFPASARRFALAKASLELTIFGRCKSALGYKEKSFLKFSSFITLPLSNSRVYPEASSQME
jgi:hypothetical protein